MPLLELVKAVMVRSGVMWRGEAVVDGVEGSGRVGLGKAVLDWQGPIRQGLAVRDGAVRYGLARRSRHGGARSGELWSGGLRIGGRGVARSGADWRLRWGSV